MTKDTVKVVVGSAGIAASTAIEQIPIDQLEGGMGILTQIIILVTNLYVNLITFKVFCTFS